MHAYLHMLHRHPVGNIQPCSCTQRNQAHCYTVGCNYVHLTDIRQCLQRDHIQQLIMNFITVVVDNNSNQQILSVGFGKAHLRTYTQNWTCTHLCMLSHRGPRNSRPCTCTQKSQVCWSRFGCSYAHPSDTHQCLQTCHR